MATYQNLLTQKAAIERKLATARKREVASVVKQINGLIAQYQLQPSELTFGGKAASAGRASKAVKAKPGRKPKAGTPAAPKYRNPETGDTWSGRGRSPKWVVGDKSNYLIESQE